MKNNFVLFQFKFKTPLHISNVRSDYGKSEKVFHSDSLYSAIIEAWNVLGLPIPDLIQEPIDFALSSMFPYFSKGLENEEIFFFPKPLGSLPINEANFDFHKKLKKIQYIDLLNYKVLLEKGTIEIVSDGNINDDFFSTSKDFDKEFIKSSTTMRNRVALEDGEDTKPYYVDRIYFQKHCGMFCLAVFDNDTIKHKVISALKYLQDEGIGTDRHIGNGLFDLKIIEDFNGLNNASNKSGYFTNLSLFCPESKEQLQTMLDEKAKYQFKKRGGWITTEPYLTLRKKSINMFTEGSIFKSVKSTNVLIKGKTVDLKPEISLLPDNAKQIHSIYRVGKSIFLPINIQ